MTTNPDELAVARATNQRLNRRAQELESELASYRRAVADWEISEDSTYVPLRSLAVIAKAAGLEVPERWELHYQRLERAEAGLRRLAAEAPTTTKPETGEDPARIDRLRPEFTEHSSVEAIDAQLRRSRAQERRWHIRTEWLISLRADRVAQKERGEWPAAGARQDGAQSS